MKFIYLPLRSNTIRLNTQQPKEQEKHMVDVLDNKTYIWPLIFDNTHVSQITLYNLKEKYSIDSIIIIDRLKNVKKETNIKDHINASGQNFLREKTPYKSFPTFPDVTHIYHTAEPDAAIVHTVGPERFSKNTNKNQIISESIGIISPVWDYVGVNVYGVGRPA